jgi:hypothetical protein
MLSGSSQGDQSQDQGVSTAAAQAGLRPSKAYCQYLKADDDRGSASNEAEAWLRRRSATPGHPPKFAEMLAPGHGTWFDMYPGRAANSSDFHQTKLSEPIHLESATPAKLG